jgi:Mg2+ and Co2+ transporter CorA
MTARDDFDSLAPQREAAFFYGLFLRGHDVTTLRQDIDVPPSMMDKWMRAHDFEASFRENLQRIYEYRKQVLAIFDCLVSNEQLQPRVQ